MIHAHVPNNTTAVAMPIHPHVAPALAIVVDDAEARPLRTIARALELRMRQAEAMPEPAVEESVFQMGGPHSGQLDSTVRPRRE